MSDSAPAASAAPASNDGGNAQVASPAAPIKGATKIAPIKAAVISRPLDLSDGISDAMPDSLTDSRDLATEDTIEAPLATADEAKTKRADKRQAESGGRDPETGRFTKPGEEQQSGDPTTTGAGETKPHSDDWDAVQEALSQSGDLPFEFGGARFRDADHAAQSFKVLRGHYKSAMKFRDQSISAAQIAEQWMGKATETRNVLKESVEIIQSLARGEKVDPARMEKFLNAKLPAKQPSQQQNQQQNTPTAAAAAAADGDIEGEIKNFLSSVNWEVINELADKHSPAHASAALGEALVKYTNKVTSRMSARLAKLETELAARVEQLGSGVAPLVQNHEQMAAFRRAHDFFNSMAEQKDGSGSPLYPELLSQSDGGYEDSDVVAGIAAAWEQLTDDVRFTQDGFDLAVLKYRRANPDKTTRRTRTAPSQSDLNGLIEGQRNRGDAVLDSQRATVTPSAHGRPTEGQFTELAAISRAGRGQKEDLGFDS